jgi:hypothetical protein
MIVIGPLVNTICSIKTRNQDSVRFSCVRVKNLSGLQFGVASWDDLSNQEILKTSNDLDRIGHRVRYASPLQRSLLKGVQGAILENNLKAILHKKHSTYSIDKEGRKYFLISGTILI